MEKPLAKKDNLILLNWFKAFSINLNALNMDGVTHFGFVVHSGACNCTVIRFPTIVFFDIVVHPHQ